MARTINGFKVALREHRVCSAAGDNGAVTVWQDDEGAWRCVFTRWRSVVEETVLGTKVWSWLKEWMPKCH